MQRGNGLGSFFRGLFCFVKPLLYLGAKAVERTLKTDSNILTDILHKQLEEPVGYIFKKSLGEAKNNIEQRIKKMRGLAWV